MLNHLIQNNFPLNGVALAFGYGSKVINQISKHELNKDDLVDFIFVVDNPYQWHQENYARNNSHYSFLKYLPNPLENITRLQEGYGAKIYFNPYVKLDDVSVKYGVIKSDHLYDDLFNWETLYVAGRLHKPVEFIVNTCDANDNLRSGLKFNKESALRAALLQLPEIFDIQLLYRTITGLSYNGDIRMIFGEDKNKVDNIVNAQSSMFNQIYLPMLRSNSVFGDSVHWNETKQTYTQDLSPKMIFKNLKLLPRGVQKTICHIHSNQAKTLDCDLVLSSLSRSINSDKVVSQAICVIVRRSSFAQTCKGLLTAGLIKSFRYSQRKLMKSLRSRLNLG